MSWKGARKDWLESWWTKPDGEVTLVESGDDPLRHFAYLTEATRRVKSKFFTNLGPLFLNYLPRPITAIEQIPRKDSSVWNLR